jgi:hypothetical protein
MLSMRYEKCRSLLLNVKFLHFFELDQNAVVTVVENISSVFIH